MKVHVTDELFGLEAFSRPIRVRPSTEEPEISGPQKPDTGHIEDTTLPVGVPVADPMDTGEWSTPGRSISDAVSLWRSLSGLFNRRLMLGLAFLVLFLFVGLCLFTLVMKTRKKAVSYELSHQTRIFKRMSRQRAVFELEYAYLRANSELLEEFPKQGWREITPHDLTYIPMPKAKTRPAGGSPW